MCVCVFGHMLYVYSREDTFVSGTHMCQWNLIHINMILNSLSLSVCVCDGVIYSVISVLVMCTAVVSVVKWR